jgi:hypothetical protein
LNWLPAFWLCSGQLIPDTILKTATSGSRWFCRTVTFFMQNFPALSLRKILLPITALYRGDYRSTIDLLGSLFGLGVTLFSLSWFDH